MEYFTINSRNGSIGEVIEDTTCKIQFTFSEDEEIRSKQKNIKSIEPACGCTSANRNSKGILIYFSVGSISKHLRSTQQKFQKRVKLIMDTGEEYTLEFHGVKLKKK